MAFVAILPPRRGRGTRLDVRLPAQLIAELEAQPDPAEALLDAWDEAELASVVKDSFGGVSREPRATLATTAIEVAPRLVAELEQAAARLEGDFDDDLTFLLTTAWREGRRDAQS